LSPSVVPGLVTVPVFVAVPVVVALPMVAVGVALAVVLGVFVTVEVVVEVTEPASASREPLALCEAIASRAACTAVIPIGAAVPPDRWTIQVAPGTSSARANRQ